MSELLLDISQMREARGRVDRSYGPDVIPPDADVYRVVDPVVLAAEIQRDRDQFHLSGTVSTAVELTCCRCLERYRLPVRESFDVLYLPQAHAPGGEETEVEDDDLTTAYYREHVIDLGQLMQEQFYLAVPVKPLCQDDCRGLCPLCGTNLNQGGCSCTQSWEDPRLTGLRRLLKKD